MQRKNSNFVLVFSKITQLADKALPSVAWLDGLHIGACASAGVDLLLTWNFKRIANIHQMASIERICRECGFELARIITPDALLQMMFANQSPDAIQAPGQSQTLKDTPCAPPP